MTPKGKIIPSCFSFSGWNERYQLTPRNILKLSPTFESLVSQKKGEGKPGSCVSSEPGNSSIKWSQLLGKNSVFLQAVAHYLWESCGVTLAKVMFHDAKANYKNSL